jgi:uncharacterized protein (DUF697 family)
MGLLEDAKEKLSTEVFSIENRTDLTEEQKITRICTIFGTTCAALAVQPIPFADVFILTPIQGIMGKKIADIRGYNISDAGMKEILIEIASLLGLGALGQQLALGLYKVGLPGLAGFTTIPLVFGITYAIGKSMDYYFLKKIKGEKIDKALFRQYHKDMKKEAKQKRKEQEGEIKKQKNEFKN